LPAHYTNEGCRHRWRSSPERHVEALIVTQSAATVISAAITQIVDSSASYPCTGANRSPQNMPRTKESMLKAATA
jgi:hypothetical protein